MIWMLSAALAAPFGTVDLITTPAPSGAWVKTAQTGDAVRVRDGAETPLEMGMELETGDQIRTTQARVKISLPDKEFLTLTEGTDLTLEERGVLQTLGDVYYSLRGAFSVEYSTVEATVEGTRFFVESEAGTLSVAQGTVRVGDTPVEKAETLKGTGSPETWNRFEMGETLQRSWTRGRPNVVLLGFLGFGWNNDGQENVFGSDPVRPFEIVRISGRASPAHRLWVTGSAAFAMTGVRERRFPWSVGADFELFPFAVGAEFMLRMYHDGSLTPGVNATGRMSIPIDRNLYLEAQARLGWVGKPYIEGSVGAGIGF